MTADDRTPVGFDSDGTPIYPMTVGQLGLCGPCSDDPGVGPDAARYAPRFDGQAARADLAEAEQYVRTAVASNLHRTPPEFLGRLLVEYDRRGVIEQRAKDATTASVVADMSALQAVWRVAHFILHGTGNTPVGTRAGNLPRRDDHVAAWIKAARDAWAGDHGDACPPEYHALDDLLDDYRLHADTGTPLGQHACAGSYCCCTSEDRSAAATEVTDRG